LSIPFLTRTPPWFAFIGHMRYGDDLHKIGGGDLLRRYSRDEADFTDKLCTMPPLVVGEITFGFQTSIRGELIAVMQMPEAMVRPGAAGAVLRAAEVAIERGARVIGLGGLTSPATGGGRRLTRHLPSSVTVTNGNALTAAVVCQNVLEAVRFVAGGRRPRIAVVGCTGSVGVAATHLLARLDFDLILVGRAVERVRDVLGEVGRRSVFRDNLACLVDADVTVLLTNDPAAVLTSDRVRAGSIVIDFAQPANVPKAAVPEFSARGVAVVEGGRVRIPGYSCSFDLGIGNRRDTLACLAETYLFAREGIRRHSLGRPSPEFALEMQAAAERRGILVPPLGLEDHPALMGAVTAIPISA
jgi:predicted amino acid dehydrogenase